LVVSRDFKLIHKAKVASKFYLNLTWNGLSFISTIFLQKFKHMFIIFDTETTGFPSRYGAPHTDIEAWDSARLVQLAWQIHDELGELVEVKNFIVKPVGFTIPYNSEKIHGISTERAQREGV